MAMTLRRFDYRLSIMIGDVLEAKRNAVVGQDVPDGDPEGGPRKLNEGEHRGYMNQGRKTSRSGKGRPSMGKSNEVSRAGILYV